MSSNLIIYITTIILKKSENNVIKVLFNIS